MYENYCDIVEDDYELDDRSDEAYEKWRDERDERSFLNEEDLPDASKELNCTKCHGKFIGHKKRTECRDCNPKGVYNYPEDLEGKAFTFTNYCPKCGTWYEGHKHRAVCKSCYIKELKETHGQPNKEQY